MARILRLTSTSNLFAHVKRRTDHGVVGSTESKMNDYTTKWSKQSLRDLKIGGKHCLTNMNIQHSTMVKLHRYL